MPKGQNWKPTEDAVLLQMVKDGKGWLAIGIRLKRTGGSVRQRYCKLVPPPRKYSDG